MYVTNKKESLPGVRRLMRSEVPLARDLWSENSMDSETTMGDATHWYPHVLCTV